MLRVLQTLPARNKGRDGKQKQKKRRGGPKRRCPDAQEPVETSDGYSGAGRSSDSNVVGDGRPGAGIAATATLMGQTDKGL